MKEKTFANILKRLKELKKIGNFSDQEIKLLSKPKRISKASLKIGNKKLPAWRILFSDALGPGKGGIRFHPGVCEDEVKSLSFWMTIKDSLAGIPYGGSKGGVQFNPKKASSRMLEEVSRRFTDAFYKNLGQDKDVPAPDVYTNSQIMAWVLDEYEKKVGHHEPAMITGKPLALQGCVLRGDATAKGGFIVMKQMIKQFKLKENSSVAVQGFGNAGANLAKMLEKDGFKVVAVSDSRGGIYNKKGLSLAKVEKAKQEKGSVSDYQAGEKVTNEELLQLPVDILVLAALENQLTKENADQVKAKIVVEIANGPTTFGADKILFSKGIHVVPDVLANAGGVIVSYFEWCQNKTGNILDKKYLENLLVKKMTHNWQRVYKTHLEHRQKIDLRTSAWLLAVRRILEAEKLRGNLN